MPVVTIEIKQPAEHDEYEDALHEQRTQLNNNYFESRPAITVVAAAFLVIQLWLMLAGPPITTGAESAGQSGKPSWTDVSLVVLTSLYLLATVAYVVVSFCQRTILRDTLDEARRSNALTLRPWLLVESVTLQDLSADALVKVMVQNHGKLPALRVIPLHRFDMQPVEAVRIHQAPDSDAPGWQVIGAGRSHTFGFRKYDITPDQIDEIEHVRALLTLTMRFKYTDALDTQGDRSTACTMSQPPPRSSVTSPKCP